MKKKLILTAIFGAMLCALPFVFKANKVAYAVGTEQVQITEEDKWTKEDTKEILSGVAVGAGGVLTALGVFVPIYVKIKKAQNDLTSATTGLTTERKNNEDFAKRLEKSENESRKQEIEFRNALKSNNEQIEKMFNTLNRIEEICKLGFVNNKELVSKGVANLISKVGENEEHKE